MRIVSKNAWHVIFSYFPFTKFLLVIQSSKKMQKIFDFSIDTYRIIYTMKNEMLNHSNMSCYYNYFTLNYPNVNPLFIKEQLLHFLDNYSEDKIIEINNIEPFSFDIINNIRRNIALDVISISHHNMNIYTYNSKNIDRISINICDKNEISTKENIDFLFNYIIPKEIKVLYIYQINNLELESYFYTKLETLTALTEFVDYTNKYQYDNMLLLDHHFKGVNLTKVKFSIQNKSIVSQVKDAINSLNCLTSIDLYFPNGTYKEFLSIVGRHKLTLKEIKIYKAIIYSYDTFSEFPSLEKLELIDIYKESNSLISNPKLKLINIKSYERNYDIYQHGNYNYYDYYIHKQMNVNHNSTPLSIIVNNPSLDTVYFENDDQPIEVQRYSIELNLLKNLRVIYMDAKNRTYNNVAALLYQIRSKTLEVIYIRDKMQIHIQDLMETCPMINTIIASDSIFIIGNPITKKYSNIIKISISMNNPNENEIDFIGACDKLEHLTVKGIISNKSFEQLIENIITLKRLKVLNLIELEVIKEHKRTDSYFKLCSFLPMLAHLESLSLPSIYKSNIKKLNQFIDLPFLKEIRFKTEIIPEWKSPQNVLSIYKGVEDVRERVNIQASYVLYKQDK